MFTPPGNNHSRLFVTRTLNLILILTLLSQSLFSTSLSTVQAASTARLQFTPPPAPPLQGTIPPVEPPAEDEPTVPAPADSLALQSLPATLPLDLRLRLERLLLEPGATAWLTLTVASAQPGLGVNLQVSLNLPPGLITSQGESGVLQWNITAPEPQQPFVQPVQLQVDAQALGSERALLWLQATVTAAGYTPLVQQHYLGIAPPAVPGGAIAQTVNGTVLQDSASGITLFIPAGAAPVGATFHYTPIFRGDSPTPTAEPTAKVAPTVIPQSTPVPTTTVPATLTLPALAPAEPAPAVTPTAPPAEPLAAAALTTTVELAEARVADPQVVISNTTPVTTAASVTVDAVVTDSVEITPVALLTPTVALTPSTAITTTPVITTVRTISDNGVRLYQQWQLEALDATQPITQFNQPLLLLIDASWLVQAGIDPNTLSFWSRELASEPWQMEGLNYDPERQLIVIQLHHFSGGAIGDGIDKRGEILPSLKSVSSDHFTGAATVNYPIEAPTGLGGMAPSLRLSYSSNNVDDVLLEAGDDNYEVQASMVGYGWNLSGLSYIDRSLRGDKGYYNLVLNNIRSNINGGRSSTAFLNEDYFTRIQPLDPSTANGNFHGWLVTATDGTAYTFGDVQPSEDWPTTDPSGKPMAVSMYLETNGAHAFDRWYLKEVKDTSGNRMTFQYEAQRGAIKNWSTCANAPASSARAWYTRSVVPTEIRWSGNPGAGLAEKLKVRFEYTDVVGTTNRLDIRTPGYDTDCTQPKYFAKRLKTIFVEVLRKDTTNTWDLIRKYELVQSHYAGSDGDPELSGGQLVKRHLLLDQIQHYGSNGSSLLNTYSFSYASYLNLGGSKPNNTTNNLRLASVDNGWNGMVEFTYQKRAVDACAVVCPNLNADQKFRYPLVTTITKDGTGNQLRTVYAYANSAVRGDYNSAGDKLYAREFMGYGTTTATQYEIAPVGNTSTTDVRYEEFNFTQGTPQTATGTPRDPRVGRSARHKIWSKTQSSCPAYYNNGTPTGGRCLFQDNTYIWGAYRRNSSGVWNAWANETTGPFWVRQDQVETWDTGATSAQAFTYDKDKQGGTQYGNLTDVAEYDGAVATGAKLRTTTTLYAPNTNPYLVNKPARVIVVDNNNVCKAETRFIYDNVDGVYTTAPTKGLLTKTQKAITACSSTASVNMYSTDWQETRMAYDAYGNQTTLHLVGSSASSGNQWFGTSYDATYKLFPTQQTQTPSGFVETGVYYGVNEENLSGGSGLWGQMKEHCAINGVCTQQSYDEFGRSLRRWERVADSTTALPSDSSANVLWSYRAPGFYSSTQKTFIVTEWHSPRCFGNFTRSHYNGLGQLVTTNQPYQDWQDVVDGCGTAALGQEIDVNYAYDGLGNQVKASVPRLVARSTHFSVRLADLSVATTTAYDALSRPASVTAPNGEVTTYVYDGRTTGVYTRDRAKATNLADAFKVNKWQTLDGLGNLKTVYTRSWSGSGWNTIAQENLVHDVTGNLTSVTHAASAGTTSMSYDLLGHKKTMTDPDLGSWSYAYDRQGSLTRQTDARGKTICLYYERALARLAIKHRRSDTSCPTASGYDSGGYPTLPSGVSVNVIYSYDGNHSSSNRSRGQLTYVNTDSQWWQSIAYNSQGLLASETVFINGAPQNYTTSYTYDNYQRLWKTVYPDNETLELGYNSMGLPAWLYSYWYGWLVHTVNYDELGRQTTLLGPLGGNIWRNTVYYPWTGNGSNGGRLQAIRVGTSNGASDRLGLNYTYDSFDNVASLVESFSGLAATPYTFSYDSQNRLTSAFGQNYSYDNAGRLTHYEGATYQPDSTHKHAIATVNALTRYQYDANGNLVTRNLAAANQQLLTWDHENHLVSISGGGLPTESYAYAVDGQRVKKVSNGVATYYPTSFYEQSSASVTKYYSFNGQRIALRVNGTLMYLHADHLGSIAYSTDLNNWGVALQGYYAYGKYRTGGTLPTDHKFTGQKLDASGLYYFNARYYDPQLGTFISPDTLVPDPTSLIDYNRYAYARANPLASNDPSGHCPTLSNGKPYKGDTLNQEAADCWRYADTILNLWDNTPEYWNGRYASKEYFSQMALTDLNSEFFKYELALYGQSDAYKTWNVQLQAQLKAHAESYKPIETGDYTSVNVTVPILAGSFIIDDYGHVYIKASYPGGAFSGSVTRGSILLNTDQGLKSIYDLSSEQQAELVPNVLIGPSWGGSAGAYFGTLGLSVNNLAPNDMTIESGFQYAPTPLSGSISYVGATVQIWPTFRFR